ncbi:MAG TPA: alpha-glucan family phosphorylase, partial [Polyangiales bacterium]|nr:alpha-glucan family phosphorylase [Polyangiales bacterium]
MHEPFTSIPRIAYFSMEVALRSEIPTYAGGLGVLAGDSVRSAADLALPLVTVTLVSRRGYFRQELDSEGRQTAEPEPWNPAEFATPLRAKVTVPIERREVWVGGWLYPLGSSTGEVQPVILLDTDHPENTPEDRRITDCLYGDGPDLRLKQEIVLGIGGVRLLDALQFDIRQYHLNEGHSALLTLELLRRFAYPQAELREGEPAHDVPRVRKLCNFTTHTPVDAGHDRFPYSLVETVLGDIVDLDVVKREGGGDVLNMTQLALNLSEYINGVAKRHAETSRKLYPGYHVRSVTNGVHPRTWTSPSFCKLYDEFLPGWSLEPELLVRADCCIPQAAIWQAHAESKRELIDVVKRATGVELDAALPILGFARRMTAYKRPDL